MQQQLFTAIEHDRFKGKVQIDIFVIPLGFQQQQGLADLLIKAELAFVHDKFLILQLRQLQDIAGQGRQLPRTLNNQPAVFLAFLRRKIMILH
ncbi:hypothetical protein D3C74_379110 [compost metagenome]